jgi:hypothetical protein
MHNPPNLARGSINMRKEHTQGAWRHRSPPRARGGIEVHPGLVGFVARELFVERDQQECQLELLLDSSQDGPTDGPWGIGANPSPVRNYLTGHTASQLALHDQAVEQFERLLASNAMPYARKQVERDLAALRLKE